MPIYAYSQSSGRIRGMALSEGLHSQAWRAQGLSLLMAPSVSNIEDYHVQDGQLVPKPQPTEAETLAKAQAEAKAAIDAQAEAFRHKFLTPGAGQAMAYQAKEAEAKRFASDSNPLPENYPFAQAEIGVTPHPKTGQVATNLAEMIAIFAYTSAAWHKAGANVEKVRRTAKYQVDQATDLDQVKAVLDGLCWPNVEV